MTLQFPAAPFDGQEFIASNGIEYTYDSSKGSWTAAVGGGGGGDFLPLNDWSLIPEA